jgi:hypothetical protein
LRASNYVEGRVGGAGEASKQVKCYKVAYNFEVKNRAKGLSSKSNPTIDAFDYCLANMLAYANFRAGAAEERNV